jgi:MazG family protein
MSDPPNEARAAISPPTFDRATALVRFLRSNCPWDARQTPESLLPYLLEEAHEVADAVVHGDAEALADELGDLLLNVAFQTVLAEERAAFTAEDVVAKLEAKMRRRHPQLYGDGPPEPWETLKAKERAAAADGAPSVLAGLSKGLDPLSRAQRIQERVSGVGFDWADARGAFDKVAEELEEVREALDATGWSTDARGRADAADPLRADGAEPARPDAAEPMRADAAEPMRGDAAEPMRADAAEPRRAHAAADALEEELGDLLFAVVNLTRLSGAHALRALQRANAKFTARFEALERIAAERGIVLGEATLEELDAVWDEVKARERGA